MAQRRRRRSVRRNPDAGNVMLVAALLAAVGVGVYVFHQQISGALTRTGFRVPLGLRYIGTDTV